MDRFSERIGITQRSKTIQRHDMSGELRNSLWNLVLEMCGRGEKKMVKTRPGSFRVTEFVLPQPLFLGANWKSMVETLAVDFFKEPVDEVPRADEHQARQWLKEKWKKLTWHEVYNLVEFVVTRFETMIEYPDFTMQQLLLKANTILERELSAYRFIGGVLTESFSEAETRAIEEAITSSTAAGLAAPAAHMRASLEMLGKKPSPDYRNSIKEAISAVESASKLVAGDEKGDLKKALGKLESSGQVHPAMSQAFEKLYAWTNDEKGVRHAMMDDSRVGFCEAKFMVVACSAFVNYLLSKGDDAALLQGGAE